MAKLLNRAYERLNRVLDLAGSQAVNDLDIESAFAVHPLDAVVQSAQKREYTFYDSVTFGGATDAGRSMDPFNGTTWDTIVTDGVPGGELVPDDWDFFVRSMGIEVSAGAGAVANWTSCQFYLQMSQVGGAPIYPISNPIDTVNATDRLPIPTAGDPLWLVGMPFRLVDAHETLNCWTITTGIVTVEFMLRGVAYPPGVLPYVP